MAVRPIGRQAVYIARQGVLAGMRLSIATMGVATAGHPCRR